MFGLDFYLSDIEELVVVLDFKLVRCFVFDFWKNFFRGKKKDFEWDKLVFDIRYIFDGVECLLLVFLVRLNYYLFFNFCKDFYGGLGGIFSFWKEVDVVFF